MYYWQGLSAIDGTYTTPVFTVKAATGKTLYAIVNEPVDFDTRAILESVDHPNDLVDVQYQMADYLSTRTNVVEYTKDYCLPMYGELAGVDAAEGTTQTVNMRVDRAVARVDVYMRKEAKNWEEVLMPTTLVVTGVSKTGFVSPKEQEVMRLPFSICYRERKSVRSLKKLLLKTRACWLTRFIFRKWSVKTIN